MISFNEKFLLLVLVVSGLFASLATAQLVENDGSWVEDVAINHSQAVIGNHIGNYQFTRRDGSVVSLEEYVGKPLLISMIFTSCHHVCPLTTRRLDEAVQAARAVMEPGSFNIITVGFDPVNDTPDAMRAFASKQVRSDVDWEFLSGDFETVNALATELGFVFYRSPRGFDHITQVSVIDREGEIYKQVYGVQFKLPWLIEPLKELVFNRPASSDGPIAGLLGRIRLFCTVYDPASDRYHFDYSIFLQMAIGLAAIFGLGLFLFRGLRKSKPG